MPFVSEDWFKWRDSCRELCRKFFYRANGTILKYNQVWDYDPYDRISGIVVELHRSQVYSDAKSHIYVRDVEYLLNFLDDLYEQVNAAVVRSNLDVYSSPENKFLNDLREVLRYSLQAKHYETRNKC